MATDRATGGFRVTGQTLLRMQTVLDETAEAHRHARDAETLPSSTPAPGPGTGWTGTSIVPAELPQWHDDLDHRWRVHRAALLAAHDDAAQLLAAKLDAYLRCDAYVAGFFRQDPSPRAPSTVRTLPSTQQPPPEPTGPAPRSDRPPLDPADPVEVRDPPGPIADLDHAVSVWRRRRDAAVDTVSALAAGLEQLDWVGPSADRFLACAHRLRRHWRDLGRAADTIGRSLTETARLAGSAAPDVPELDRSPLTATSSAPTPAERPRSSRRSRT